MKNLYERLKPEVKKRLLSEGEKYSLVHSSIIPQLQKTLFYSDLTMGDISRLINFSNTETYRWSMWDLKYGDLLFNKEND